MSTDEGMFLRKPLADATLEEAYELVDDPSFWDETMPPILAVFRLSLDDYYRLTVKQHRLLFDYINGNS